MSSFGSSVINKSSKKLAPKAPIQRRRPAAPPAASLEPQEYTTLVSPSGTNHGGSKDPSDSAQPDRGSVVQGPHTPTAPETQVTSDEQGHTVSAKQPVPALESTSQSIGDARLQLTQNVQREPSVEPQPRPSHDILPQPIPDAQSQPFVGHELQKGRRNQQRQAHQRSVVPELDAIESESRPAKRRRVGKTPAEASSTGKELKSVGRETPNQATNPTLADLLRAEENHNHQIEHSRREAVTLATSTPARQKASKKASNDGGLGESGASGDRTTTRQAREQAKDSGRAGKARSSTRKATANTKPTGKRQARKAKGQETSKLIGDDRYEDTTVLTEAPQEDAAHSPVMTPSQSQHTDQALNAAVNVEIAASLVDTQSVEEPTTGPSRTPLLEVPKTRKRQYKKRHAAEANVDLSQEAQAESQIVDAGPLFKRQRKDKQVAAQAVQNESRETGPELPAKRQRNREQDADLAALNEGHAVDSKPPAKRGRKNRQDATQGRTGDGEEAASEPSVKRSRKRKSVTGTTAINDAVEESPESEQNVVNAGQQNDEVAERSSITTRSTRQRAKAKTMEKPPPRPELQQDSENNDPVVPAISELRESARDGTAVANEDGTSEAGEVEERDVSVLKRKRKRAETPEDAGSHEINEKSVKMFELCKDERRGKKSKLEAEFQNIDWSEVVRRRKEAEKRARAEGKKASDSARQQLNEAGTEPPVIAGPQLQLRDGQIVLNSSSLVLNSHAMPDEAEAAVEESDLTKRINTASWLYDNKRDPEDRFHHRSGKWTADEDGVFYGALKMFGTDFDMISKMFPNRTRRMIKQKFTREERTNEDKIRRTLLGQPDPINLQTYCDATDKPMDYYKDPEITYKELEQAEIQQREEIEQERERQQEVQKKKQQAAQAKAEAAARRRAGEKVPRRKRKNKTQAAEGNPNAEPGARPETVGATDRAADGTQTLSSKPAGSSAKTPKGRRQGGSRKAVIAPQNKAASNPVEAPDNGHTAADGPGTSTGVASVAAHVQEGEDSEAVETNEPDIETAVAEDEADETIDPDEGSYDQQDSDADDHHYEEEGGYSSTGDVDEPVETIES